MEIEVKSLVITYKLHQRTADRDTEVRGEQELCQLAAGPSVGTGVPSSDNPGPGHVVSIVLNAVKALI